MTSLPISAEWIEAANSSAGPKTPTGGMGPENEEFLLRAFRSFGEAAASLELSYEKLHSEVARLQRELAASNDELARTSEENRRVRFQLDRILQGLPCGVLVASAEGRILKGNPESLRLLGCAQQVVPQRLSELSDSLKQFLDCSRRANGETEAQFTDARNAVRWLASVHASLQDGSSVFILRDISERKRLEKIEAQLQRQRELAAISALLAHEIRNPLGSLELFAGLLMESALDAEQRSWVEHVQAGLRTLAATVNNVLQFHSLPEAQCAPVDLGRLLEWAREFFGPLARQSGTTLSLQNDLLGVTFLSDRHRLEQVLSNLILNSIHAMRDGGWVELGGRKLIAGAGETAVLTVADTGPGIPPEDLDSVFSPGFSLRPGSLGLGLAVCRNIVEQHGGSMHAANRPSNGAIFTVAFPLTAHTQGMEH